MYTFVFVTAALSSPSPARPPAPNPTKVDKRVVANDLYSQRARRRLATYLRLRLLELREAQLDRAADAIQGRLRIEELLRPVAVPQSQAPAAASHKSGEPLLPY